MATPDSVISTDRNIHNSAGVYVKEDDRSSTIPPAARTQTIGAIVGSSSKGPVGLPNLVTSANEFIQVYGYPNKDISYMHYCALAFLEESSALWVTRVADTSLYAGLTVSLSSGRNVVNMDDARWGGAAAPDDLKGKGRVDVNAFPFEAQDLFIIYGLSTGESFNNISVDIIPSSSDTIATHAFYINVYEGRVLKEHILVTLDDSYIYDGKQCSIEDRINKGINASKYIRVKVNTKSTFYLNDNSVKVVNTAIFSTSALLQGGDSGFDPDVTKILEGWEYYSSKELVDVHVLINGGYTDYRVHRALERIARERGDCFAILDVPSYKQKVSDAIAYRQNRPVAEGLPRNLSALSAGGNPIIMDSTYAALYTPDLLILDKYTDRRIYVPPSGHIAATYAKTDRDFNTWFAPAGMNRGKMNVLGAKIEYNQNDRDILVDNQINPTRLIAGVGIRLWGADTLKRSPSALSNINVRRLLIYLERVLSQSSLYAVFDPNDPILRSQLTEMCLQFLKPIKDARGLYEFQVVCNDTNNTSETIAAGDVYLDLYLDPVLPAKRIHLTATINRTGVRFAGA